MSAEHRLDAIPPTAAIRAQHARLRPLIGELARTAASLGRWSARNSPPRLASATAVLDNEVLAWLRAEEEVLYPIAERTVGEAGCLRALRAGSSDITRRAEALAALVARLKGRPPSGAELDALRAGLYGLWAILGQFLSIEEEVLFEALDRSVSGDELEQAASTLSQITGVPAASAGS